MLCFKTAQPQRKTVCLVTDLDKVGRKNSSFSIQFTLEPSLLTGLGDVFQHIPHLHCELVAHGSFKVDQDQRLCSAATNRAENHITFTNPDALAIRVIWPDISKPRQTSDHRKLTKFMYHGDGSIKCNFNAVKEQMSNHPFRP